MGTGFQRAKQGVLLYIIIIYTGTYAAERTLSSRAHSRWDNRTECGFFFVHTQQFIFLPNHKTDRAHANFLPNADHFSKNAFLHRGTTVSRLPSRGQRHHETIFARFICGWISIMNARRKTIVKSKTNTTVWVYLLHWIVKKCHNEFEN